MKKRILSLILALVLCMGLSGTTLGAADSIQQEVNIRNIGDTFAKCNGTYAVIDISGNLWMWGNNERGQLGNGSTKDTDVPQKVLSDVVSVDVGEYHVGAVCRDGSLWLWGQATYGEMGNGTRGKNNSSRNFFHLIDPLYQKTPLKVMDGVSAVNCGPYFTAVVKTDGSLWTWGWNVFSTLGNGGVSDSYFYELYLDNTKAKGFLQTTPVKILDGVVNVKGGAGSVIALDKVGNLWEWGRNSSKPEKVLGNVVSIFSCNKLDAYNHQLIMEDSGLYYGTFATEKILDDVVAVCGAGDRNLALKSDGTLWSISQKFDYDKSKTIYYTGQVAENVAAVSAHNGLLYLTMDGKLYDDGELLADLPFSLPKFARLELNGGTSTSGTLLCTGESGKITVPEDPIKEGYIFSGWYQDKYLSTAWDFNIPLETGITLYAKWDDPAAIAAAEEAAAEQQAKEAAAGSASKINASIIVIAVALVVAVTVALVLARKKKVLKTAGASVSERCPFCGTVNAPNAKFCQGCGKPLDGGEG